MRFKELSLNAQTAYAELVDQVHSLELQTSLVGMTGAFHKRKLKNKDYWYFGYRDIDGKGRMVYVGPDSERVQQLVERFNTDKEIPAVTPQVKAALALGCAGTLPKHFRIIKRLGEYGLFRAGGILIGTHAFIAYGNMLGVRWTDGGATMDVDFAHAGNNVSLALPTNVNLDVRSALDSLEMGLLPITQLNGKTGAQFRNPKDAELRLDFLTCEHRKDKLVEVPNLKIALEPLRFMEFSLESPIQGCVISTEGACLVNIPSPERFAVHKLVVYGERPIAQRTKANKDLLQAAAVISYYVETGRSDEFLAAWEDAMGRGKGWSKRLVQGWEAMVRNAPELKGVVRFY
ncbi:MAG TPA: nucleotidyltransferase domain-containing protein [Rhodocyclaceae bacterium]|nr:nucleotidyltransferase domain-containing protein [Rhodocyclaceae bacterium]